MLYDFPELTLVQNGFVKCYDQPYNYTTTAKDLLMCSGSIIFVGAKSLTTAMEFSLGAFGNRSNVFALSSSKTTAYYDSVGGANWYLLSNKSFGFANDSTVNLDSCDFGEGSADCQSRLCWHLDQGKGGYRAGCNVSLNNDPNWRKVLYTINSTYQCVPGRIFNVFIMSASCNAP